MTSHEVQGSTALSATEGGRLADLEVTIERGLTTFVEVGAALSEIRESRLYRQTHGTTGKWQRRRSSGSKADWRRLMG